MTKKILDWLLARYTYKSVKKRLFSLGLFFCFFTLFVTFYPRIFFKNDKAIVLLIVGSFVFPIYFLYLMAKLVEQYGWQNNDSNIMHEAENNLYKYFDEVTSGKEYIMIQPHKVYPLLADLLEKEHYHVYFKCDRYAIYKKGM